MQTTKISNGVQPVYTIAPWGLEGALVEVEANLSRHLPKIIVVGLADTSVQEAKERVWAAIENSGCQFPRQKVVINLSPAQLRKEGGSYDLPMAISVLQAADSIKLPEAKTAWLGELSLSGELKAVPGALVMVSALSQMGFKQVFVPAGNAREVSIVKGLDIYPVSHLQQLIEHLNGEFAIEPIESADFRPQIAKTLIDMSEVKGQSVAKRVLEIAAAGGHNVLMVGPPGAGKSMLAKSLLSILPDMNLTESLEVSKIHSLAGLLLEENRLISHRIIRSPHHSASVSAVIGGGSWPKPGEISLAHHNILFLDEILEFPRPVLEALRQPLEDKVITVSRIRGSLNFPANFILVATANPCPCGYLTDKTRECHCRPAEIERYQKRLSGPVLDRIDLHLTLQKVKNKHLSQTANEAENSQAIRSRVILARQRQARRFRSSPIRLNADIESGQIRQYCQLSIDSNNLLSQATENLNLSARAYFKILKISRTIADLEGKSNIAAEHLLEALQYRSKIFGRV